MRFLSAPPPVGGKSRFRLQNRSSRNVSSASAAPHTGTEEGSGGGTPSGGTFVVQRTPLGAYPSAFVALSISAPGERPRSGLPDTRGRPRTASVSSRPRRAARIGSRAPHDPLRRQIAGRPQTGRGPAPACGSDSIGAGRRGAPGPRRASRGTSSTRPAAPPPQPRTPAPELAGASS